MKYLLISILCLAITLPFFTNDDNKTSEVIYEDYHKLMINNFNLTYEGEAENDALKQIIQEAFPNLFDEIVSIHLFKNIDNEKFSYVYKIDGFKESIASAAALNVNKNEYEKLTFTGSCPNSRPCLGLCKTCACNPEPQFGVICGCFDETSGTCHIF